MTDAFQVHYDRVAPLLAAAAEITSELDLESALDRAMAAATMLTGARYAAVGVHGGGARGFDTGHFYTYGIDASARAAIGENPRGRGVLAELIESAEPVLIADVSRHPESCGFPTGHPRVEALLGVPVSVRATRWGTLFVADKPEGFDEQDAQALSALADWVGIAVANTQAYARVRGRLELLEHADRALEAAYSVASALAGETDLQVVLELIAKRARALVDARSLFIGLIEGPELVLVSSAGERAGQLDGTRYPVRGSAAEIVIEGRRPIQVEELPEAARERIELLGGAGSGIVAPLIFRARGVGALVAIGRMGDGAAYADSDLRILEAFAASAALAVGSAQSITAKTLRLGFETAENERIRWARELHDGAIAELEAVRDLLRNARARMPASELSELDPLLDAADGRLAAGVDSIHSLISDMRPVALSELGVRPALEALARRTAALSGLRIDLAVDLAHEQGRADTRLSSIVEETAYRVIQESLTNVIKHARARHATVSLVERETVAITVQDDGSGFDPRPENRGFGLLGLEERAQFLGGSFELESRVGGGTTVRVELPATHIELPDFEREPGSGA